jgi:hypothetical protein
VAGSDAFFNFEYGPEYTPIELSLTVFIPSGHGAVFAGGIFWNDEQAAETADSIRHGLNQPLFGIKCPSTSDNIAWTTGPSDDTGAFFNASAHIGSKRETCVRLRQRFSVDASLFNDEGYGSRISRLLSMLATMIEQDAICASACMPVDEHGLLRRL